MLEANFWQDKENSKKVIKEKKLFEDLLNTYKNSIEKLLDLDDLSDLALEEKNEIVKKEILQKMYDTLKVTSGKIHVIGCSPYSREALVSKNKITTVAGLKGVKIRSPEGLAAEVFRLVGASPSSIPFSEVYTSLEKGIVDAADASAYVNNNASGMHKIAKFPIYPGIHSMANLQFIMNKKLFNKLSKDNQVALETWYIAAYTEMRRAADIEDKELVAKHKAGGDITVVDWAQEERDKFRKISVGAWENYAKKSPLAREALNSQLAFMKKMGML